MTSRLGAVLVANADGPCGDWALEAMAGRADRLIATVSPGSANPLTGIPNLECVTLDPADEAAWAALTASLQARFGTLAAVINGVPPGAPGSANLLATWVGLKHLLQLMPQGEGGIMATLRRAPDRADPRAEGDLEAMRLSMAAALLDGIQLGVRPRSNRLVFEPDVAEDAFKSALELLTDGRSSFMTGAEITLDGHAPADSRGGDLMGKVVLVTGATSGIGRATAVEIGARGGWVAVGGRKLALAEETLALVRAAGGGGLVVPLDVTDPQAWRAAIASIMKARGALHGLVNNAGESKNLRIDQLAAADVAFLLGINYEGALHGMREAIEPLRASRGGAIINVASVAGIRAGPGGSAYGGSKAALIGASRSWARALEGQAPRIRVNALQPGLIWSDGVADSLGEEGAQKFRAMIEPKTPLGRVGRPEEVARVIAYLLSDSAAPISGQTINVSGGLELNFP